MRQAHTNTSIAENDPAHGAEGAVRSHALEVTGVLRPYVNALMAVEMSATGPIPLAIAPHESFVLSVPFGLDSDVERKGRLGENTNLTGIRRRTGTFTGAGDCITLFALLTPLGVVQLLESRPVDKVPRIRAPVAALLDERITRGLESDVALASTLEDKLSAFGGWLEKRASANRQHSTSAMRLCKDPLLSVETLADEQHVSRRQLERDYGQWIGTSPRHLPQVARVQAVSRLAQTGATLVDIATDVGFADQAHMSRVVRQLTGLAPRSFVSPRPSPMARIWCRATAGGTVYL